MLLPTIPEGIVWAILLLPIASLMTIGFITKPYPKLSGYVTIAAIGTAFAFSLWTLDSVIDNDGHRLALGTYEWLTISTDNTVLERAGGQSLTIDLALNIDGLSAIMLVVVTAVSLLVQIYSQGYMAGDGGYARYFAWMSLFTAAMLGLVMFDSILMVYVFWELVGLGSYLLIGFWFHKKSAADAAKKAFLTTRLGDIGFLLGILLIWTKADTFNIPVIQEMALSGELSDTVITLFALGVFAGAAGKSAQFPLHNWLPDAMEGPTPVSALIHAATMVAAGVYLVARMFPVFQASDDAMTTVAYIGGFTAIFAASMGIVMTDIKRVLAYSTISQLGYMMLALGVGGYVAAIFHLFTHAFFKALLFLGSGSVNHATGTFDMRKMGGLRNYMPITYFTFLIGSLSLAGVFPLAGFWSKDEILGSAWDDNQLLFWVAMIVVFMTAFYTFRAVFLTFHGEYKGGEPSEHGAHDAHGGEPHESPSVMALPLLILAVPAVLAGLLNAPFNQDIAHLLEGALPLESEELLHHAEFSWPIAIGSTALALAGIASAWLVYEAKTVRSEELQRVFGPAHTVVAEKYYVDELYEDVVVRNGLMGVVVAVTQWFDTNIVDGAVNGSANVTRRAGDGLRWLQSGSVQAYGSLGFAGLIVAAVLMLVLIEA
ncbi:MAG: NADH-quinone oxidoreductase subunit L [Dehalococcoidia bacterium]